MRGIILAGGTGSRLGALTRVTNKHLLPVGHLPMIYYPIKKLVGAGITNIMLITGTEHVGDFVGLLGSGKELNCKLTYRVQDEAGGIAQALGLAEDFCLDGHHPCMVLLGDNIFKDSLSLYSGDGAQLLLTNVANPGRFGVVTLADEPPPRIISIEEKPANPRSNLIVTGVYQYPPDVFDVIRTLKPSTRGELEITDVNLWYMQNSAISYSFTSGYWIDAGTPESLLKANNLVVADPPQF